MSNVEMQPHFPLPASSRQKSQMPCSACSKLTCRGDWWAKASRVQTRPTFPFITKNDKDNVQLSAMENHDGILPFTAMAPRGVVPASHVLAFLAFPETSLRGSERSFRSVISTPCWGDPGSRTP